MCTFISDEAASEAADKLNWVDVEDFKRVLASLKRVTETFDFNDCNPAGKILKEAREAIQRKWPTAHVRTKGNEGKDKLRLLVTVREDKMAQLKLIVEEKKNSYSQKVTIKLQGKAEKRTVDAAVKKVRTETRELYKGCRVNITYEPSSNEVQVEVDGSAKHCLPAIVGRMQFELHQTSIDTCKPTGLASHDGKAKTGERIRQLLALKVDSPARDRATCCLKVAYLMIAKAKCIVYGGFVRDYLIGGDINKVKDIDSSVTTSIDQAFQTLQALGPQCNYTLSVLNNRSQAERDLRIVKFTFQCGEEVEADLVYVKQPATQVDASINNVKITPDGTLCKKVDCPAAKAHSLSDIMQQIQKKQFHLYMNWGQESPNYCVTRATKLLSKGYVCLSGIPPVHKSMFGAQYQGLIN